MDDRSDTNAATILVAEDDSAARTIVCRRLERAGYEVDAVADGVEALHRVHACVPDILVTDWMMPLLDGVELCRRLKKHTVYRRVYTILVTARDNREDRILGLDGGADDYITKPFDPDELLARVRVGVRLGRLQQELADQQHDRALVEMALALGHEINNPLTSLVGYLDMLLETDGDFSTERVRGWLEQCRDDAMRVAGIVSKLRQMKRPRLTQCVPGVQMVDIASST